jgi:hypothetical protein
LGLGVAWNALLVVLTRALGVPFTVLAGWSAPATLLLWAVALARPRSAPASAAALPSLARNRGAVAAVIAAALLAALHAGRLGTPVTYYSDSPDHIGTVRRMMAEGDAFPARRVLQGRRKGRRGPAQGLWHPQVALIAKLARVEAADAWVSCSAAIAPFFILNAAALGWMVAGARGAAATAWAALLLGAGATGWAPLRKAVFSTFLADQLCLAAAIAWLADSAQRRRRSRIAAAGLALSAVLTHLYSAFQLAIIARRMAAGGRCCATAHCSAGARRAFGTAAVMAAACLPFACGARSTRVRRRTRSTPRPRG